MTGATKTFENTAHIEGVRIRWCEGNYMTKRRIEKVRKVISAVQEFYPQKQVFGVDIQQHNEGNDLHAVKVIFFDKRRVRDHESDY